MILLNKKKKQRDSSVKITIGNKRALLSIHDRRRRQEQTQIVSRQEQQNPNTTNRPTNQPTAAQG